MKIKAEISQGDLSVTASEVTNRVMVIKVEFISQDITVQEYVEPPAISGVIDSLIEQGQFDNGWLKRILQESITICNGITDYATCRDISSFFVPTLQDKVTTNMSNRFRGNPHLLALPTLDWSDAEDVSGLYFNNKVMVEIDMPGSENIKMWRQAFYGCSSVQQIYRLDLSGAVSLVDTFTYCSNLRILPSVDTSKVTHFTNFLNSCTCLERTESIDFSSAQSDINLGQNLYTKLNALTYLRVNGTISQNIIIYADNLTEESVASVMNALINAPSSQRTVTLTKALANKIPEATKQIASDKGWKLITI